MALTTAAIVMATTGPFKAFRMQTGTFHSYMHKVYVNNAKEKVLNSRLLTRTSINQFSHFFSSRDFHGLPFNIQLLAK